MTREFFCLNDEGCIQIKNTTLTQKSEYTPCEVTYMTS